MGEVPEEELRNDVRQFLAEFKALVLEKGMRVKDNLKNREALLASGLTPKQREEEVLSLSITNYCSGPHEDAFKPGHYWVFGKLINGVEFYIKLKIAGEPGREYAVCFSFHPPEWSLSYPLAD